MTLMRVVASTDDGPLVFDAACSADGEISLLPYPVGGWWGGLRSNALYPFILHSDGRIDFGADPEDEEEDRSRRFGQTSFLRNPIEIGSRHYIKHGEDVYQLLIIKAESLGIADVPF